MSNQWLSFISNEDLCSVLLELQEKVQKKKANKDKEFTKNAIDPFTALFQMVFLNINADQWKQFEQNRQLEKSLQNNIGLFHQKLISKLQGWENPKNKPGYDVVNHEQKIIAEVKNKHNTLKGSDRSKTHHRLKQLVTDKGQTTKGYTAYLVQIIPLKKERYNIPFTTSDNSLGEKVPVHESVRIIDGASFYELITGDPHALRRIFETLPLALQTIGVNVDDQKISRSKEYFALSIAD